MSRWKTGLLAVLLLGLGMFLALGQNNPAEPGALGEVRITAKKYEFEPSVIRVPKGSHVRLIVTSLDHEHGFKLEAFHIDQKLPKGEPVTIEFDVSQTGTFPFACSHFCGLGHKKMKGELVVE